jgi:hypothetical protein
VTPSCSERLTRQKELGVVCRVHDGAPVGITHGDWYGGEDIVNGRGIDGAEMTSRARVTNDGNDGRKRGRTRFFITRFMLSYLVGGFPLS